MHPLQARQPRLPACLCAALHASLTEARRAPQTHSCAANLPLQEEGAIKWWIGNAAEDGKMATVFARCAAVRVRCMPRTQGHAYREGRGGCTPALSPGCAALVVLPSGCDALPSA